MPNALFRHPDWIRPVVKVNTGQNYEDGQSIKRCQSPVLPESATMVQWIDQLHVLLLAATHICCALHKKYIQDQKCSLAIQLLYEIVQLRRQRQSYIIIALRHMPRADAHIALSLEP